MSIRQHIPDDIRRVSKVIGLALWLDDPTAWDNAASVIAARAAPHRRKALAFAVLLTLSDDEVDDVLTSLFSPSAMEVAA